VALFQNMVKFGASSPARATRCTDESQILHGRAYRTFTLASHIFRYQRRVVSI